MNKFLKGNYMINIHESNAASAEAKGEDITAIFENRALEKLGGSIAFVMKGNQFAWGEWGDDESAG
jgi:hypothetical protein